MSRYGNPNQEIAPSTLDTGAGSFYNFLEAAFERQIRRSPMRQSDLGRKTDQEKWDDLSSEAQDETLSEVESDLETLRKNFDPSSFPEGAKLAYRLFEYECLQKIEANKWRNHDYPINQMSGWQSEIPSFLINNHQIASLEDAEAYISRLRGVKKLVSQIVYGLEERRRVGIYAPKFVYDYVIRDCRNLIDGIPFHATGVDSPLFADFKSKVAALEIDYELKPKLIRGAADALRRYVEPAYRDLITCAIRIEAVATTDDGVWKLPDGAEFYDFALRQMTTTDLSSDQIHEYGLSEVQRIHSEMQVILKENGFQGSLQEFFRHVSSDPALSFPNTEEGRTSYLLKATRVIEEMKSHLRIAFKRIPKADLIVKRVEAFRERSAGLAFYQSPSPDGSRPGIYYVNLSNMNILKKHQLEALAYHEGIPGHHMQRAIAVELSGVPTFQKFSSYAAYAEGWGLYAELLAKEMGGYLDWKSDFGRLAMELWRATRLVVDTGIHARRWTRQEAIQYLAANTPNPEREIVSGVERYIVLPAQAVSYKVGMQRILELREDAKRRLRAAFILPEFHDVVLSSGEVPLTLLSEMVERWISERDRRAA